MSLVQHSNDLNEVNFDPLHSSVKIRYALEELRKILIKYKLHFHIEVFNMSYFEQIIDSKIANDSGSVDLSFNETINEETIAQLLKDSTISTIEIDVLRDLYDLFHKLNVEIYTHKYACDYFYRGSMETTITIKRFPVVCCRVDFDEKDLKSK